MSNIFQKKATMQDPLFQLMPEQALDLNTLFNPAQQSSSGAGGQLGDSGSPAENIESLSQESINEMSEIVNQAVQEPVNESYESYESSASTLAERIKKVEEEYNSKPIAVNGKLQKRLLTLAKTLTKMEYLKQAHSLCKLLEE